MMFLDKGAHVYSKQQTKKWQESPSALSISDITVAPLLCKQALIKFLLFEAEQLLEKNAGAILL